MSPSQLVDLQRAEPLREAVDLLAPRWTTWALQTIHQRGQMRFTEVSAALPWLGMQATQQVLRRMHDGGLVDRSPTGYAVTPLGHTALKTQGALADWHRTHFSDGPALAEAERSEDALRRLRGRGAVEVITALSEHGPLRREVLRASTELATGSMHYRLQQLQDDGLVERAGSSQRAPYALTSAATALDPTVYATLSAVHQASRVSPSAADRPVAVEPRFADRANAAVLRTPSTPSAMFSHAPTPPTRVPAYVTQLSHPSRAR
ncbi:winged helix-turn-helix transcriptional regulator [Streptomyces sp. NPDC050095]|uniref:winged helix-turn-helix transcriptional regulator n=1 Tax=unclassified Streptomyces TaxID=2593676 RepID=UPI00342A9C07